tara:strand:- start:1693 stop:2694 length:1002 start_codon:yes stop_codon:yes gene_type:complete
MSIYSESGWFSSHYELADKVCILGMLKSLCPDNINAESTPAQMIEQISEIIFEHNCQYAATESLNIADNIRKLDETKKLDALVLLIIVSCCQTDGLQDRLEILLSNWGDYFRVDDRIRLALIALQKNDIATLKNDNIIGESYHNKSSRDHGLEQLGWFEYRRQMKCMKKGWEYKKLKEKYAFLNTIDESTLGGQLKKLLRAQKLSLPGERHGFAEFFLWHDLTHLLSDNKTNYPGELGANVFTAACSKKGKIVIMLWGLMQFNLGVPLAVVATPGKNHLKELSSVKNYLHSLQSGSKCTLDVLEWPIEELHQDLKMDLSAVRRKYNIETSGQK